MTNIAQNTEASTNLVRSYLADNKLTKKALAWKLGVSGSAISSWVKGPTAPLLTEYAMEYLMSVPAAREVIKLRSKVDRLQAQILRMDARHLVNAQPEPKLHDLSTFRVIHYPLLKKQRLLCCDNTVMLHCCSKNTNGGVNVSRIGLETLEIYQNERGAECIVRMESQDGWIREVALDDLPRKKYETWPDGREGFCIDLWEIDPSVVPSIPAHR